MTTNASYIEQLQQVSKWHGQSPESEEMVSSFILLIRFVKTNVKSLIINNRCLNFQVISIGWGNLRSPHLPITEFDTSLDAESSNPGSQV